MLEDLKILHSIITQSGEISIAQKRIAMKKVQDLASEYQKEKTTQEQLITSLKTLDEELQDTLKKLSTSQKKVEKLESEIETLKAKIEKQTTKGKKNVSTTTEPSSS